MDIFVVSTIVLHNVARYPPSLLFKEHSPTVFILSRIVAEFSMP